VNFLRRKDKRKGPMKYRISLARNDTGSLAIAIALVMALALEVERIVDLMVAGRMHVEVTIDPDVSPVIAAFP
jgi:hypothetical protein